MANTLRKALPRVGAGKEGIPQPLPPLPANSPLPRAVALRGREGDGISGLKGEFKGPLLQAELLRLSELHCFPANRCLPVRVQSGDCS